MNFTKKQVIITVAAALVIISAIIFLPAVFKANKEDNAAAQLSEIYNDQFVVTKSTVSTFGDEFEITVQSEDTKIVYDFDVQGESYEGEYYAENVNAKVSDLVQPLVPDALVMSNVHLQGLTEEISLEEADVQKATIRLLNLNELTDEVAQEIAQTLKNQFGEIPVQIDVFVVDQERVFDGVKFEVENYFQLSKIKSESFIDFKFHEQNFSF
ncbi:MAG: fucose permease [Solibacillus sp.]|uniref:fucose permease n=1 Tax=Solibacillus sp. TaxID=1909654 RepID=UPI0033159C27